LGRIAPGWRIFVCGNKDCSGLRSLRWRLFSACFFSGIDVLRWCLRGDKNRCHLCCCCVLVRCKNYVVRDFELLGKKIGISKENFKTDVQSCEKNR